PGLYSQQNNVRCKTIETAGFIKDFLSVRIKIPDPNCEIYTVDDCGSPEDWNYRFYRVRPQNSYSAGKQLESWTKCLKTRKDKARCFGAGSDLHKCRSRACARAGSAAAMQRSTS